MWQRAAFASGRRLPLCGGTRLTSTRKASSIPTHSRIRKGVVNWHTHYDARFDGPLTSAQIEQYYHDGYLLVEAIIPSQQIQDCLAAVDAMVDELATGLYKHGLITDLCNDPQQYNTFSRLTAIDKQYQGAAVLLHKKGILPPQFIDLWELDILNDIAFQLVQPSADKPQIAVNPVWNIRSKIPAFEEGTVPWHQDVAYLDPKCWNVHQLTAWIPLLDVGTLEGCMQVIKGGHLSGNVATHTSCAGGTWYVDLHESMLEKELLNGETMSDKVVDCPVKAGSVLFLGNTIPHRSLENFSDKIRWSLDLRWQKYDEPNGMDEVKPNLLIRDKSQRKHRTDWDTWNALNRITAVESETDQKQLKESFDPIIYGPWMSKERWERVNDNKHTLAFDESC